MRTGSVRALDACLTTPRCPAAVAAALVAALLATHPRGAAPRFYDDDPAWREVDAEDASKVQVWEPNLLYDLTENLFAHPGDPDFERRAMNVNTVDEVPDGNWFTNRIGSRNMSAAEITRASNTSDGPAPGT
jgi:hypothetical protein